MKYRSLKEIKNHQNATHVLDNLRAKSQQTLTVNFAQVAKQILSAWTVGFMYALSVFE